MLQHIVDFLVDYFTNLNAKKILGGVIVLVGLGIMGNMGAGRGGDMTILYAVGGIFVAGIGSIIIYYDMAKDRTPSSYNELDMLANVQKQDEAPKGTGWHYVNQEPENKDIPKK